MLWTINVDDIYRQQANIIDLYLLKISVNSGFIFRVMVEHVSVALVESSLRQEEINF